MRSKKDVITAGWNIVTKIRAMLDSGDMDHYDSYIGKLSMAVWMTGDKELQAELFTLAGRR